MLQNTSETLFKDNDMYKRITYILIAASLFLSCRKTPSDTTGDISVSARVENGIVSAGGVVTSSPVLTIEIRAKGDAYDVDRLVVEGTLNGKPFESRPFYLDLDDHSASVQILSGADFKGYIDAPYYGEYPFTGAVRTETPSSSFPEQPFSGTLWIDTGKETSFSLLLGTRGNRYDLESKLPAIESLSDTLILKYSPSDSYVEFDYEVSFDGTDEGAVSGTVKEKDWDGIIKIPFTIPQEAKDVTIKAAARNSSGENAVDTKFAVGEFDPFDFEILPMEAIVANRENTIRVKAFSLISTKFLAIVSVDGTVISQNTVHFDDFAASIPVVVPARYDKEHTLSVKLTSDNGLESAEHEIRFRTKDVALDEVIIDSRSSKGGTISVSVQTDDSDWRPEFAKREFDVKFVPENATVKSLNLSGGSSSASATIEDGKLTISPAGAGESVFTIAPSDPYGIKPFNLKVGVYCYYKIYIDISPFGEGNRLYGEPFVHTYQGQGNIWPDFESGGYMQHRYTSDVPTHNGSLLFTATCPQGGIVHQPVTITFTANIRETKTSSFVGNESSTVWKCWEDSPYVASSTVSTYIDITYPNGKTNVPYDIFSFIGKYEKLPSINKGYEFRVFDLQVSFDAKFETEYKKAVFVQSFKKPKADIANNLYPVYESTYWLNKYIYRHDVKL